MVVILEKGQSVNINLPKFVVGLGWEVNASSIADLDAFVFILGENKKLLTDSYFVFFNNLVSPDNAVELEHTGDNFTGEGDGDIESIKIDLSKINPNATELCFVVSIYDAEVYKQDFGQVHNSFVRVYNPDNNEEIFKYELEEDFSVETAVEFVRLYKRNGEWKFEAIGIGVKGDLRDLINKYN